jgi:DNA-directed RNA polymerase subunit RPC12/RpoP
MATQDGKQRNITLEDREAQAARFRGEIFPCPVCGEALAFRIAITNKPYCHCNSCGIQIFFRGQVGIERLLRLLDSGVVAAGEGSQAIVLYNRLQRLEKDERDLKNRQGVIFRNQDLDNTIAAVRVEIEKVRRELQILSGTRRKK